MLSVILAFSVFWTIEALICSILAVVSSTEAACSLEDCESDWAVAETWPEALLRLSAAVRTSPMISVSLAIIVLMPASMLLESLLRVSTCTLSLPSATCATIFATCAGSPPNCARMPRISRIARIEEATMMPRFSKAAIFLTCRVASSVSLRLLVASCS
ncbi:MAG: hypothetical protein AW09_003907 [Candidatus Accumulibacter phosphatis]|uniref:Uncharacterized protein n=1 Tax=Candidatus Accumulibacter phosphatis TaxID=327160 RepID=A0A080LRS1_9PROT|nr:MAG: hypothetical protein AW09_003907 [Candidatus Accumulibacter phosphatis]